MGIQVIPLGAGQGKLHNIIMHISYIHFNMYIINMRELSVCVDVCAHTYFGYVQ